MCQPIQTTNWQIIKAVGRSDLCLKLEILKKTIGVLIILFSMNFGVLAIAIGNAAFAMVSMIINIIPNRRLIDYSILEQIIDIGPSALLSLLMGGAVIAVGKISLPEILVLLLQVVAGGCTYILLSYICKLDSLMYILGMAKSYLKKSEK